MTKKTLEELAAEHLVLEKNRPNVDPTSDEYRVHMHRIYLIYEEMVDRVGIVACHKFLNQARATYELLDPS